ncbi:MAG TPA: fibronectin type III domain-containing protein [Gammaproteobacteria bacterium]|nr:fibronectin type III domain-containing protein [Gammaproteobacteria bacterium]
MKFGTGLSPFLPVTLLVLAGLSGCGGGATPATGQAPAPSSGKTSTSSQQAFTLSVTPASPTKVSMAWQGATASGDSYQVYRNGELDTSVATDGKTAADEGLAPDTQYCYQVTVVNADGAGTASSNQSCVTTAPLAGWNIQRITTAPPLSLALDPQGHQRLAFCGATGVFYQAQQGDSSWSTVQVEGGVDCYTALLAVGGDGSNHIVYLDENTDTLRYATDASGSWSISSVDGADGAEFYQLALDSGNHVHLAYRLFTGQAGACFQLVYETNASGAWQSTVVADTDAYPVIAVDGAGAAHIAYLDGTAVNGSYPVHYLTDASGAWTDGVVASSADPKSLLAIAVGPAGHARLVYKSEASLEYASNVSGAWQTNTVDGFNPDGPEIDKYGAYDVSIALDSAGQPHMSYEDATGNLKYATPGLDGWNTSYVDTEGTQNEIRMDAAGHAHIVYGNADNLYSKLAVSP